MAAGEDGGAEDEDEWEKTHCGRDGAVAARELEIKGHVVDGDGSSCVDGGSAAEEQHGVPVAEELGREDARRCRGEDGEGLLDPKDDKQHKRDDKQGDDLRAVPGVESAA